MVGGRGTAMRAGAAACARSTPRVGRGTAGCASRGGVSSSSSRYDEDDMRVQFGEGFHPTNTRHNNNKQEEEGWDMALTAEAGGLEPLLVIVKAQLQLGEGGLGEGLTLDCDEWTYN